MMDYLMIKLIKENFEKKDSGVSYRDLKIMTGIILSICLPFIGYLLYTLFTME